MKFPLAAFVVMTAICTFFAGAILAAGSIIAGCDRSGVVVDAADASTNASGTNCPPDFNAATVPDCTQAQGIATLPVETFNDHMGTTVFAAEDLYSYTDGTANIFFQDIRGNVADGGYEPPVVPLDLCTPHNTTPGLAGNGVLHMFGGPYLSWGGGIGVAMQKLNGRDPGNGGNNVDLSTSTNMDPAAPKGFCCIGKPSAGPCQVMSDSVFGPTCPPVDGEYAVSIGAIDVSAYEGVSFWARRGYTGQGGIRINVGDKNTDDDLNYLAQREQLSTGQPQPLHCQRVRECACRNHDDCVHLSGEAIAIASGDSGASPPADLLTNGGLFCGDLPSNSNLSQGCVGLNGGPSLCCDTTACDAPYPAYPNDLIPDAALIPGRPLVWPGGDPQFYGRPCTPYAWANGIGSNWCYDPARDPPPAAPTQMCGDHWVSVVTLDTDWHFYKIPFSDLHQQGFAQKSEQLDLHSVSVVRFTWDVGYVDDWIDDVSFYRAM